MDQGMEDEEGIVVRDGKYERFATGIDRNDV